MKIIFFCVTSDLSVNLTGMRIVKNSNDIENYFFTLILKLSNGMCL